jgi:hypothetical protein
MGKTCAASVMQMQECLGPEESFGNKAAVEPESDGYTGQILCTQYFL